MKWKKDIEISVSIYLWRRILYRKKEYRDLKKARICDIFYNRFHGVTAYMWTKWYIRRHINSGSSGYKIQNLQQ